MNRIFLVRRLPSCLSDLLLIELFFLRDIDVLGVDDGSSFSLLFSLCLFISLLLPLSLLVAGRAISINHIKLGLL